MKSKKMPFVVLLVVFAHCSLFAQVKSDEMGKLINAVEQNYSGFKMISKSQQPAYQAAKGKALKSILNCKNSGQKLGVVKEYLSFFKDNHLLAFTGDFMSFAVNELGFKLDAPSFTKVDSSTCIFTIPSFLGDNNAVIDSLIRKHEGDLLHAKNLIIDIRGNRGGNDACFYSLIPLLYTNDFTVHEFYILASQRNLERYKEQLSADRLGVMKDSMGSLVAFSANKPDISTETWKLRTLSMPINVAIIVDRFVGSSAEQFLLYAKQSRKVKIYGENTSGTLDCTNPDLFQFFNGDITVTIPTMISSRVWNRAGIENVGVQPDIYIPDMMKAVEFTSLMLGRM